jgi:type IV pilus assembly protein PilC
MFNDLGTPIPRMTLWLNVFGSFLITYPVQIIIVVFTLILTCILLLRLLAFRLAVHHILLKIPIFGQLILEYNLVRLTRALTTLVSSGITFTQAIQASKGTLKNEAFRSSLDKIYPVVLHGGTFSDAISMHPKLYPDQLVQLILVGEQSGKLGYSLEKAGLHYERSVQFQTQMLTTVIEPILMLIAGILVGSLAYSMFAPLYGIVEHI